MSRICRHPRREARKASATVCAEERVKRSPEEQLAKLDFGQEVNGKRVPYSATKERVRLQKLIAEAAKPKAKAEKASEPQGEEAPASEKPKRKTAKNSKTPAKRRPAKAG